MNHLPPNDPAAEAIEQQAAAWVLRTDRGLTAAEQDEFLQWLAADRRHGAALARHKRNWDRLNRLGQWLPEHSPQPNRDLLAPRPQPAFRLLAGRRAWLAPLALAAALAVGFFLWQARTAPPPPTAVPVIASITSRTLEDGSVVELNRGAVISVLYTPGERRVQLERGEAHFTVAKNKARPFIVSAGGVAVRAVGTAFNVRLDSAAVDVLVTEGVVQVKQPAMGGVPSPREPEPLQLSAGERTSVPFAVAAVSPVVVPVTKAQAEDILAWQPRMLDFTATPLKGIVGEFNRHNDPIRIVIADTALARTDVSASLRSDNVEGFIRLLEAGFGVRAERAGDTITLRKAP
jgi:transmembrane sensor